MQPGPTQSETFPERSQTPHVPLTTDAFGDDEGRMGVATLGDAEGEYVIGRDAHAQIADDDAIPVRDDAIEAPGEPAQALDDRGRSRCQ